MRNLNKRCILLFAKDPTGNIKTRIAAKLGCETTAKLYKCFLFDMLGMLENIAIPFEIVFYPPQSKARLKKFLGNSYSYTPQKGEDLGQRMKNAFLTAFVNGYNQVVIIGTDIPDLPAGIITDAFERLKSVDAVIGPAADGGYYLIGFSKSSFTQRIFENISWGMAKVFDQTLCALKNQDKTVAVLPVWNDIDTIDDLRRFVSRAGGTALRTVSFILNEIPRLNDTQNYVKV